MGKNEREIINQFIQSIRLDGYIRKEYAFPSRNYCPKNKETDEITKRLGKIVSKRCDLVIERENEIEFIEAKTKLNASAVGQLLLYKDLYYHKCKLEGKQPKKVILTAIFGVSDQDVVVLCQRYGIRALNVWKLSNSKKAKKE